MPILRHFDAAQLLQEKVASAGMLLKTVLIPAPFMACHGLELVLKMQGVFIRESQSPCRLSFPMRKASSGPACIERAPVKQEVRDEGYD